MEVERGVEKILAETSRDIKNNLIDPQQMRNVGMVLLSMGLLTEEGYFYVLSNALYTLADAMSSFLKVSSMPLSLEYRGRTEKVLEDVKNEVSQALQSMSEAIREHDSCKAMSSAAVLLKLSYMINNLAENLKNIVIVGPEE
ncbi:hypothetical protein IG193_07420 [Infirmifilum lucidum]|uniref:PhoU domain-containing protein n=1 Tax=Infirmifilum lucidum TaxID=2776706 RepID=A0A7L9FFI9_9CREN|nr:hypothetical protein [Infirmifilum lucidum]QOJ78578.1 hypothetical protein IG193_07420 [Infirmifilum lucidum]